MKTLLKQSIMVIIIVVIIVVIRHRVTPTVPMPPAKDIHEPTIQIPLQTKPLDTLQESWQLIRLPNRKYQVLVRYKGQIKGKFTAVKQKQNDASGQTFTAVGPVQFGTDKYTAREIHVNPNGVSGYIVFQKAAQQGDTVTSNR